MEKIVEVVPIVGMVARPLGKVGTNPKKVNDRSLEVVLR